jgi:hypothetical protein
VTLVGGEAVTDGDGEGGAEEEATAGKGEERRRRCRLDLSPATGQQLWAASTGEEGGSP